LINLLLLWPLWIKGQQRYVSSFLFALWCFWDSSESLPPPQATTAALGSSSTNAVALQQRVEELAVEVRRLRGDSGDLSRRLRVVERNHQHVVGSIVRRIFFCNAFLVFMLLGSSLQASLQQAMVQQTNFLQSLKAYVRNVYNCTSGILLHLPVLIEANISDSQKQLQNIDALLPSPQIPSQRHQAQCPASPPYPATVQQLQSGNPGGYGLSMVEPLASSSVAFPTNLSVMCDVPMQDSPHSPSNDLSSPRASPCTPLSPQSPWDMTSPAIHSPGLAYQGSSATGSEVLVSALPFGSLSSPRIQQNLGGLGNVGVSLRGVGEGAAGDANAYTMW
jgi:hypothetical protein